MLNRPILTLITVLFLALSVNAQEITVEPGLSNRVEVVKPQYMPPSELLNFLGVTASDGRGILKWHVADKYHVVEIRHNETANLLVLSGESADIDYVTDLIDKADIPPRQIEIEVKIIEVSKSKMYDIGIDWDMLIDISNPRVTTGYRKDLVKTTTVQGESSNESIRDATDKDFSFTAATYLADVINVLDQTGAGSIHNAPRILTLNNRRAELLDGQRVTYVSRYSSYNSIYETSTMDAGLNLSVLPSLGESGYITLEVIAELTTLAATIADSPVKSGQMVENTVIVKDGESVILGGLSKVVQTSTHRRFPVLGHILPFLFSHKVTVDDEVQSFIVLTPRVVDFNTAIDKQALEVIEGK
ncbi:MAG: hypothetical protein GY839_20000 [candidate division Zixibacteria bacterium]|nr:hypothetical protein [candidate division Zixibacteria bacterium]